MRTKPKDVLYCGVRSSVIKNARPNLHKWNTKRFMEFIVRRYWIHIAKDVKGLSAPWTSDPILKDYRFTNVRREHDKQTRYLIDTVVKDDSLSLEDKIVNCFMFRAWNNYETFAFFGGCWSAEFWYCDATKEHFREAYRIELRKHPKRKWWSAAYNQGGTKAAWKFPAGDGYQRAYKESDAKHHDDWEPDIPLRPFHIGPWLKEQNIVERLINAFDQEEAFKIIKEVRGFSTFLAYQVFVDLTYIKEFPFSENEFVVAGPGCVKGLDYLFRDTDGMTPEECIFWLRDNFDQLCEKYTSLTSKDIFTDLPEYDQCMNVMSLENCLCEVSKYIRAIKGTGRPRQRYKPSKEN